MTWEDELEGFSFFDVEKSIKSGGVWCGVRANRSIVVGQMNFFKSLIDHLSRAKTGHICEYTF